MGSLKLVVVVLVLVGPAIAASSRNPALRLLGRLALGALTLACVAGVLFALKVGASAGWSSDGPGILMVMLAVPFFGGGALLFGWMLLSSFGEAPGGLEAE